MLEVTSSTLPQTTAAPFLHDASFPASSKAAEKETVYAPQGSSGGWVIWQEMFAELIGSHELTWRLFLRDFSARYRQSLLGYVWAVAPALVSAATFSWLNRSNLLPVGETQLPYPLFVLLGTTVWQLFAGGLTNATQSLVNAGSLITKINFPRETLVISSVAQAVFDFLIRFALVIAGIVVFHVVPAWTFIFLPLLAIPLFLLTLGLGYFFALANGVLRDVGQIIALLLTFWMFLTPVVYPVKNAASLLNVLNPVAPFVIAAQDLTSRGCLTQPGNFLIGCVVSVVVFLFGWRVFHLAEPRIAERV